MLKTYELLEQPPIAFRRYFVTVQREYPNLVETLQKLIPSNKHIVFELSETEIINNFSLAKELRKKISFASMQ